MTIPLVQQVVGTQSLTYYQTCSVQVRVFFPSLHEATTTSYYLLRISTDQIAIIHVEWNGYHRYFSHFFPISPSNSLRPYLKQIYVHTLICDNERFSYEACHLKYIWLYAGLTLRKFVPKSYSR